MPAPTDEQLSKFIDESRKAGLGEDIIDAELHKMLTVDKAPIAGPGAPSNPTFDPRVAGSYRVLRGGQVVTNKAVVKQVEEADLGQQASMMLGPAGTIPSIAGYLMGKGIEGIAARAGNQPEKMPTPGGVATDVAIMATLPSVASAAGRTGLRAIKAVGTHGTQIAENLLSRLAGVGTEELQVAAKTPAITQGTAPRAFDVLNRMRNALGAIKEGGIPEYAQARKLLENARPVKLSPALGILSKGVPQPIGPEERAAAKELRGTVKDILKATQSSSWAQAMNKRVPAPLAERLKQVLQKMADFSGRPSDDPLNPILKRAAASLRNGIESSLPSSQMRSEYSQLMRQTSQKMEVTKNLTQKIGEHRDTAENFVRLLHRAGKTEQRQLVQRFDRLFGTDFMSQSRIADALEAFGGQTPEFTTPRFTATGGLLGPGLGATIGGAVGGLPGAGAGALVGLAAGSPRGAISFERGTIATREALKAVARSGGRGLDAAEKMFPTITAALTPKLRNTINAIFRNPHLGPEEKALEVERALGQPSE